MAGLFCDLWWKMRVIGRYLFVLIQRMKLVMLKLGGLISTTNFACHVSLNHGLRVSTWWLLCIQVFVSLALLVRLNRLTIRLSFVLVDCFEGTYLRFYC